MAQTIGIGRRLNRKGAVKGQPGTETQVEWEDQENAVNPQLDRQA
jgi:hypothetical protein